MDILKSLWFNKHFDVYHSGECGYTSISRVHFVILLWLSPSDCIKTEAKIAHKLHRSMQQDVVTWKSVSSFTRTTQFHPYPMRWM
ncbi:hypothetical protein GQ600_26916 [Phytophthora cactorum]|nr:hypothetical protein GQ600_26916 [Phytophthora cactorum]